MIKLLKKALPKLKITYKQIKQLKLYYYFLIKQNKIINLTTIINKKEVYIKHFIDSCILLKNFSFFNNTKVGDVGSGAGFPGIVLKIFCPTIDLTIIESLKKRCLFLQQLVIKLKLNNVKIINTRAEKYSLKHSECFNIIVSRAVANLRILLEIVVRLVKIKGIIICYKGPNVYKELKIIKKTLYVLNLKLKKIQYEKIFEIIERNICFFIKTSSTKKKYPRCFNKIKKNPIV